MSEELINLSPIEPGAKLPDKRYFKIGEASILLGVKPHVLRYWETEFPQIRPYKSRTGQRLYRHRDVEALQLIQKLLYHERYTIAGARQALLAMYENDVVSNEELILSDEALEEIENQVFEARPESVPVPISVPVPVPLPVPVPALEAPKDDVLELVEQKMVQMAEAPELRVRLEKARVQLQEIIQALNA